MQSRIVVNPREESLSLLQTHKVLRNTYFLLALTLTFSAVIASITITLNLPRPGLLVMLVGFYGLLYFVNRFADRAEGILLAFAFTGFLGYTAGSIVSLYLSAGFGNSVVLALAGTAAIFFTCSAYVLVTKRNMSFLAGTIAALFVVLVLGFIASFVFNMPAMQVALSALFVIFSTLAILYETSNIIHGGETNYIRATVNLFVSLYNLFLSLLHLLSVFSDD